MKYKRLAHSVYICNYHIILVSKYRRKIFNQGIFAYFDQRLEELRKYHPEIEFLEVNHDQDHVHLLVSIPPKMSVGSVVRKIKSNLARDLRQKFPFISKVYWGTQSVWSSGYFVSTVGASEQVIRNYIKKQGEEDAGQAKLELG